ncbi:poly-beta-1,6-N-acetyl-D-glucosamine biosynthesis protein PgaD [Dyella soli]|uniref:Poly-beta-1,6-N-acetyl-D-glucosamine biosynthesis protein PgaD n=1 Tax=Dyella soli TaxID=522319 RepID=A0A4V2NLL6_9GAMM|nr:poly-beta-1,6-N-acetyl-D-glucosamine biosynthesis protein PgaD [Dyella soli]TCI09621.1 poly-beta-1,6-N-acetyl-D-glucosamine biosynthesis protein PgaD [Dyella soli]
MSRRPLIIERPELTSVVRRIFALVVTVLAWASWLLILLPILRLPLDSMGLHLPLPAIHWGAIYRSSPVASRIALTALLMSTLVLVVRHVWEIFGPPGKFDGDRSQPLTVAQLAAAGPMPVECLPAWQCEQVLYVTHDEHGAMVRVTTERD